MPLTPININTQAVAASFLRVRAALDWWLRALESCIPNRIAQTFATRRVKTRLFVDKNQVLVGVASGEWITSQALLAATDPRQLVTPDVDIALADEVVLLKKITVPKEVRGDIEKAVQYQIKQHIPLSDRSIVTGFVANDAAHDETGLSVTIAAVRNDTVRRALDAAQSLGCMPAKLLTFSGNIVLKVGEVDQLQRTRRLTGFVLVGLLIAQVMALPLVDIQRVRNANILLKDELNELVGKTKVSADLKKTVDRRVSDSGVLNGQLSQDNFARGLSLLTSHAPADVWVSDLQYDGRMFRITGNAKDAADWTLKLQQRPEFENVRLENVSSPANDAEAGRFQMTLYIKPEGEAAK